MKPNRLKIPLLLLLLLLTAERKPSILATGRGAERRERLVEQAVRLLSDELRKKSVSRTESAAARGLLWCVRFTREDRNFNYIFSDYVQMLNELALNRRSPAMRKASEKLIRAALMRGEENLPAIFQKNHDGKWDFITVIPFLYKYELNSAPYVRFYKTGLPPGFRYPYKHTFQEALKLQDHDDLGEYLIYSSYVHFTRTRFPHKHTFRLPPDRFPEYIRAVSRLRFTAGSGDKGASRSNAVGAKNDDDESDDDDAYSLQNYFVTHLVFVMTHYGERPFGRGPFQRRIIAYIKKHYPHARRHADEDLDLVAEFVHCLKLGGEGDSPLVRDGVEFLLAKQNADGSWGDAEDFKKTPYDAIHPTWTVITALHQK